FLLDQLPIQALAQFSRPIAMILVVLGITMLSVVVGELLPKYLALARPERFAILLARPISIFISLTSLFSRTLSWMAALLMKLTGVKPSAGESAVTEEEINQMLVEGKDKGVFDETEKEFVRSVFDFADSTVSRALKPRTDVIALDSKASTTELLETLRTHGHSRYPVYEGDIDHVIGLIYTKDLLTASTSLDKIDLSRIMRKPFFVHNNMPLPTLLRAFQKGENHLAIVLDEYGGTDGIITLEDILEELVGEIQDEYDTEDAPIASQSDGTLYADGDVWPGDINETINSHLPEDNVDTLAGLYIDTVGHVPELNERIDIADCRLTVIAKEKNRILRIKIEKVSSPE
ncbi:MAG: hemolysin family protein, partial [candidate division Zixibacteria bacterium]